MTMSNQPPHAGDSQALQFIVEEFIDVEIDARPPRATAVKALQARAARHLLPGPRRGAFSRQQGALMALDLESFGQLRHDVRDWLERLVIREWPPREGDAAIEGPKIVVTPVAWTTPHRQLGVEGRATDVFWFYLVWLLGRVGPEAIEVCPARKPDSIAVCSRLYVRRGRAKIYCSERCRARMATARARGVVYVDL